jgi:hypothetical protein
MGVNAAAITAAAFVFWALAGFAHAREPKLAVLIAAPWPGEVSMSHDLAATSLALQRRGFAADDIVVLDGPQTRESILRLLASVRRRIAPWTAGEVFMAVSGHGSFTGKTVSDARPAILLSAREPSTGHMLFWDEVFNALAAPARVRIVLLPDV